jgi:hypothetical protein
MKNEPNVGDKVAVSKVDSELLVESEDTQKGGS